MRNQSHYYERERRKGRTVSATMHVLFLIVAIVGLPKFLQPEIPEDPSAISVEILPISAISNVKPQEKMPENVKVDKVQEATAKKAAPAVKSADNPAPPPPAPEVVPEKPKDNKEAVEKLALEKAAREKAVQDKKKKEEEKEKKKKKEEDDFNAMMKGMHHDKVKEDVKKVDKQVEKKDPAQTQSISSHFDPNMQVSISEKDAIMSQFAKCWSPPIGAKDAANLVVLLNAKYAPNGAVIKVELADESRARYNSDSFFRSAAESAIRAVKQCTPLVNLPANYNIWHYMELKFDPKNML